MEITFWLKKMVLDILKIKMLSYGHLHKYKYKIITGKVTLGQHRNITQSHKLKGLDCVVLLSSSMRKQLGKTLVL